MQKKKKNGNPKTAKAKERLKNSTDSWLKLKGVSGSKQKKG